MWGATQPISHLQIKCAVSIHAPVWGATITSTFKHSVLLFQSTHPCGVRPAQAIGCKDVSVSIHAPVWGATLNGWLFSINPEVSIHAPVWGATNCKLNQRSRLCFNPRTRVGCDSAWTLTNCHWPCFNPRTRVGCDTHSIQCGI